MGQTDGVKVVLFVIAVVGDQVYAGIELLKVIDQLIMEPVSKEESSLTNKFQVPFADQPFKTEIACSGKKVPVKGAVPAVIAVTAVGEKQVFV